MNENQSKQNKPRLDFIRALLAHSPEKEIEEAEEIFMRYVEICMKEENFAEDGSFDRCKCRLYDELVDQ